MNCADFETRLHELLDARASIEADRDLSDHAATCESCRRERTTYLALLDAVAEMPRPEPRADLIARVMAELTAPDIDRPAVSRRPLSRAIAFAFAVAAALLVAAFPVYLLWNAGDGETTVAETEGDVAPAVVEAAADPPIGELVREVNDRYTSLAETTQESYAELALLLPGVRPRQERDADAAPRDDDAAKGAVKSRGWVDDMADGLKPVTNSTAGAFTFLLEALPAEAPGEIS